MTCPETHIYEPLRTWHRNPMVVYQKVRNQT